MVHRRARGFDEETALQHDALALGPARGAVRRRPRVRWSDAAGAHDAVVEGRRVVGSAEGVDVQVSDPLVSRLHCELEARDDGLWVRDLGSKNGTYVEGVYVAAARVGHGARVRLGATELRVEDDAAPAPVDVWPEERFGPLVGGSVAMRELFARLARVAATDATVLIEGETGTGKELVAQALHDASQRARGPLVVVDCAALPESLLEAELFGHEKGAFTGAVAAREGAFEAADGGTLFLDEIGELPLAMQPKLLRALESRTVRRVGATAHRKVDVRFVSATHRDLRTMVNTGGFREDLFFRLAVLPVTVPPLRARLEDLPALAAHFLPRGAAPLPPELLRELAARPWYGNVRELRNFVERAVALGAREALAMTEGTRERAGASASGSSGRASNGDVPLPAVPLDLPFKEIRERWSDHLEREYIRGLLARHGRNVTAVAEAAGLDRKYVHRLIKKHDL